MEKRDKENINEIYCIDPYFVEFTHITVLNETNCGQLVSFKTVIQCRKFGTDTPAPSQDFLFCPTTPMFEPDMFFPPSNFTPWSRFQCKLYSANIFLYSFEDIFPTCSAVLNLGRY